MQTIEPVFGHSGPYYGKYRGIVTDNQDPNNMGRLKSQVPKLLGDVETGWALPSFPYAGDGAGVYTVPPPGSGVWIEFEGGDISSPIWSGCWFAEDKVPEDCEGNRATPSLKIIKSDSGLLISFNDEDNKIHVSDENGQNMMEISVSDGKITIKGSSKAIVEAPAIELVEGATHFLVFGDDLLTYLNTMVTTINTHTHPGQTAMGMPVTPMTPVPLIQPPQPTLLSTKVKTG